MNEIREAIIFLQAQKKLSLMFVMEHCFKRDMPNENERKNVCLYAAAAAAVVG